MSHRALQAGVTLIETLITIGIIGIILGILIPALGSMRDRAREAVCVANLHSLAQTFEVYAQVHKGTYPWTPMEPNGKWYFLRGPKETEIGVRFQAPSMTIQWPFVVQEVAPLAEHAATWVCPGSPRRKDAPWLRNPERDSLGLAFTPSSYTYSQSFVAEPRLWSSSAPATEEGRRALFRPVRVDEVHSPSAKVLLYDAERSHLSLRRRTPLALDSTPMAFADSHAEVLRISQAASPALYGIQDNGRRLHDTPNGVLGRDY